MIRQPIVTVAGHVDHGKTTLLDSLRGTSVQEGEAGGITQKISFTSFPREKIFSRCGLKENSKMEIPGFLFIDTPGHAAFSNLRKRGGALADLAVLVIDINEGIKPQTAEVIEILKINKTPFVIAANKVDNISGWHKHVGGIKESIDKQAINVRQDFDEKLFTLMGSFQNRGFDATPFYDISDFSTKLAIIPCSGKTGEGIPELLMTLCGLSQKFLKGRLTLGEDAKGVVLEVKKEKTGHYLEAILYDGLLQANKEIAIASFGEPIISKIRILEEILPLSSKFKPVLRAGAATGIRMQLSENIEVLPGMPFQVYKGDKEQIKIEFEKQVGEKIKVEGFGVIIKADSLGSLEALITLLREEKINICRAGIGKIDKKDVISASANLKEDACQAVILGFNVTHEEDIKELPLKDIKIIEEPVVYKLIERVKEYQESKRKEMQKEKLMGLTAVCKLKILKDCVFHNSNPAIFGVRVEGGKLRENTPLMDETGNPIERVKKIQADKKGVSEAVKDKEVAISLTGTNFERQLVDKDFLYSDLSGNVYREFKKNKELLTPDEVVVLQRIAQIKRAKDPSWGV